MEQHTDESEFIDMMPRLQKSRLEESEYMEYEASLNACHSIKNSVDWVEEKGLIKGRKEGRKEEKIVIAISMIDEGMDNEVIGKLKYLSFEEIEELRKR